MMIVKSFFFSLLLFPFALFGEIIPIDSIESVWNEVPFTTKNTLILFDVDDTLIACDDQILRPKATSLLKKMLTSSERSVDQKQKEFFWSIVCSQRKASLVNPEVYSLFLNFKKKNSKVIALTAMQTGKIGVIDNLETWRRGELLSFGFDFSQAFPEFPNIAFETFSFLSAPPVFHYGILCSSQATKGDALINFLEHVQFFPDKVIFVDDTLAQLQCVEKALQKKQIPFTGYHYREASLLPGEVDEQLAHFQLKYLLTNHKWLSDEEAKSFLSGV